MGNKIISFDFHNELDIVLAFKKTLQLGKLIGLGHSQSNQFAKAVSDVCTNSIQYTQKGMARFEIVEKDKDKFLVCTICDKGTETSGMPVASSGKEHKKRRETELKNALRDLELFYIDPDPVHGTMVAIGFPVKNNIKITPETIQEWLTRFRSEVATSPYEELKLKNLELIKLLEELRKKNAELTGHYNDIKILNNQLQAKNKELNDFAFIISHDFHTPLTSLKLWLELALGQTEPEKRNEFISNALRSTSKFENTIDELVKVIYKKNNSSNEICQINKVFQKLYTEFQDHLNKAKGKIVCSFFDEPIQIEQPYLESILRNLILNSIKYKSEKDELKIELNTYLEPEYVVLQVKDNGIGIDLSIGKENIFKPFIRATTAAEGKGIGLHIVKEIMEKAGGKIEVESIPKVGSSFYCYFPRIPEQSLLHDN